MQHLYTTQDFEFNIKIPLHSWTTDYKLYYTEFLVASEID